MYTNYYIISNSLLYIVVYIKSNVLYESVVRMCS